MIRLIGIDVDGTLVGASGVVQPEVWSAARRATAAGIHLALCSGRAAFGVALEYASTLDADGWHVFQNGASVVDLGGGESRSVPLADAVVQALIERSRASGSILELYADREYVTESTADWAREHADLLGVPFEPRSFDALAGPVVRAQWLLSKDAARALLAQSHAGVEIAMSTSPLMPDTAFVGITTAGVSKGSAMRSIADEYGIDMSEVMYVGDADNDLSAMNVAGHPVAMGNASPAVLAAAATIVGDVDAGGLVQALAMALERGTSM